MKNEFTIFFAIPFDSLTRDTYEKITARLREYYRNQSNRYMLITIIGDKRVGSSKEYSEVTSFKAQNEDLHTQFVKDIKKSHVVVADLTNGNPNVHFELGIALATNKNVLRVTGRQVDEMGFDIRNLVASEYRDAEELFLIITKYLDVFFKIKSLGFERDLAELYRKLPPINLPGTPGEVDKTRGQIWQTVNPIAIFRDGGIKLRGQFLYTLKNRTAWLGVIFRMSEVDKSGYLLRFCQNGQIELAAHPGPGVIEKKKCAADEMAKVLDIHINIQNDEIEAKINNIELYFDARLDLQAIGGVYLASFEAQAFFESTETINRDTI